MIPLTLLFNRYTAGAALAVALAGGGYAYRTIIAPAYSKDSQFAGNAQLAAAYMQKASASLAGEIAATVAVVAQQA